MFSFVEAFTPNLALVVVTGNEHNFFAPVLRLHRNQWAPKGHVISEDLENWGTAEIVISFSSFRWRRSVDQGKFSKFWLIIFFSGPISYIFRILFWVLHFKSPTLDARHLGFRETRYIFSIARLTLFPIKSEPFLTFLLLLFPLYKLFMFIVRTCRVLTESEIVSPTTYGQLYWQVSMQKLFQKSRSRR